MAKSKTNNINILNRKARFEYEILSKYTAGIALTGTEIKSIRKGKANIADAFCEFDKKTELFVINMHIEEYSHGNHYNHAPKRKRKLLLNKQELNKLNRKVKDIGITIVPLRVFINDRGFAKLEIALARGKKLYDKRQSLKEKDIKRDIERAKG